MTPEEIMYQRFKEQGFDHITSRELVFTTMRATTPDTSEKPNHDV